MKLIGFAIVATLVSVPTRCDAEIKGRVIDPTGEIIEREG
jgi:hypothetical protein